MSSLTPDTPIVRHPHLVDADMDGDTVMMSIERGEFFGISGTGTRVWELLAQDTTLARIVPAICAEFEVDEATCSTDMLAFVTELMALGLVIRA